jgi:hypothetical protein
MRKSMMFAASAVLCLAAVDAPAVTLIDFESSPVGAVADGATIGGITFTSALGTGLAIGNYGSQSAGNGLAAFGDLDGNFIKGAIAGGASYISLMFGNDDPDFLSPGDLAVLKVFSGATLLSTVTIELTSPDDILNQSISYTGLFDNFSFAYTNANGSPFTGGNGKNTGLAEIIDNIEIGFASGAVPEPASWAMMIGGLAFVGFAMRRRSVKVSFA